LRFKKRAIVSPDYIISNAKMDNKYRIRKNLEGINSELFQVTVRRLPEGTEKKKHENAQDSDELTEIQT
jgi:hypothetical protein